MTKRLVEGFALAGLLALLVPEAFATPYATAITNTGSTISFRLNEAADSVKIIYNGGTSTNDLGSRAAGLQSVNLAVTGTFKIEVNKDPGFGYLQGVLTSVSANTNKLLRFNAPRGVAVNQDPASPLFGRIYVANADTGSLAASGVFPARNLVQGDGIFALNADFTDALGQGDVALTAGINWRTNLNDTANKPFRIEVGEDGNLYISDYTTPTNALTGNLWVADGNLSINSGTNVFVFDPNISGRFPSSVIARGSLSGGNLKIYGIYPDKSYDYDFFGFPATSFSVLQRWDVNAGPLPSSVPPVRVTDLPILIADVPSVLSDFDMAPDGKFFLAQNRSSGLESGLWVVDPAKDTDGSGFGDIVFSSLFVSTQLGSTNDILLQTRAVKVSPDNSVAALIRDDNRIWILPLTNGIPDLSQRLLIDNPPTTTLGRDIGFDAAGNLYISTSGQGAVKVLSPGFGSRAVTGSDGTFAITRLTNNPPQVTITSTDTNMYERLAADTANFTVTRLGTVGAPLDVNLSFSGSAAAGTDYAAPSTTITIPAGKISATATIAPINNTLLDGDRTAIISVAPNAGYAIGSNSAVSVLIRDDEQPSFPVLFSDDFDSDHSANYTIQFGADNAQQDYLADFNFDYGAAGIPSAPHSQGGSTRGLKITVNKDATGSAAGVNVYANNVTFSNEYALRFDMFLTFSNAAGTTEHAIFGFNHSGALTNRTLSAAAVPGGDGEWAAIETDGSGSSSGRSYAIFASTNSTFAAPFSSASARTFDPYFTAPPYLGIPGGSPAGQWVDVEMSQTNLAGNMVWTLKINGIIILSRTNNGASSTSGTIMMGHMDSFASVGNANNYTIFDNVRVVNLTSTRANISTIHIVGGNVEINFTADPADAASAYTLQSSTVVTGGFAADAGATITALGGGLFRATSPNVGSPQRFYRIVK